MEKWSVTRARVRSCTNAVEYSSSSVLVPNACRLAGKSLAPRPREHIVQHLSDEHNDTRHEENKCGVAQGNRVADPVHVKKWVRIPHSERPVYECIDDPGDGPGEGSGDRAPSDPG